VPLHREQCSRWFLKPASFGVWYLTGFLHVSNMVGLCVERQLSALCVKGWCALSGSSVLCASKDGVR